jgi:hypothetical protein
MNRSRIAVAVVALVAITFLSMAPAAQALPLRSKPSISESGASWLDMAFAWLGNLLPGQGDTTRTMNKTLIQPIDGPGGGGVIAYTGSCIDPDGNRVPCPRLIF